MKAILFLLLLPACGYAQFGPQLPDRVYEHRKLPYKPLVRGVNVMAECEQVKPLEVRGVNIGLQLLGVFIVPYVVIFQPCNVIRTPHRSDDTQVETIATVHLSNADTLVHVKGLDLRLMGTFPAASLDGVGLTVGVSLYPLQSGAAISVFGNISSELHGLQVALWSNSTDIGKGVQIGLFNYADDCNCLQLGLLNRNGKMLRPLVNWKRRRVQHSDKVIMP